MAYPDPVPGLVIRYAYLWRDEYHQGRDEGVKDRPCAVILAREIIEGEIHVVVLPVTHAPPANPNDVLEIPPQTKKRLGLDGDRSWVILTEANDFGWPGPDLRPKVTAGDPTDIAYGSLPRTLFNQIRDLFVEKRVARNAASIYRS